MPRDFFLLSNGLAELAQPVTAAALAEAHPLWRADLAALGEISSMPGAFASDGVLLCGPCASTMDVARELVGLGVLGPWGSVITPM
ncbi:MAG TPA: hypothetical protein VN419_09965, partial [Humidesulfovibrio sp.]|nr:hypothetical protein [Humidesulfovibrio sp.]